MEIGIFKTKKEYDSTTLTRMLNLPSWVVCYGIKTTSKRRMIITHLSLSLSLFSLSFCLLLYHHNLEQAQNIHCFIPFVCPFLVYDWTGLWVAFSNFQLSQHVGKGSKVFSGILNGGLMISVPLCWPVIFFFLTNFVTFFDSKNLQRFWKRKILGFFFCLNFKFN